MNVESFLVCDAATDYGGKLNVLGAYDAILGASAPIQIQSMVFAARIRFRHDEQGVKACEIATIDYDGRAALPTFKAQIAVPVPDERDSAVVNLILSVNNVSFPRPGRYRIDLLVDARVAASLPLDVMLRQPGA